MSVRVPVVCLLAISVLVFAGGAEASASTVPSLELWASKTRVPVGGGIELRVKMATPSRVPIEAGDVHIEYAFPGQRWTTLTELETNSRGRYSNTYAIPVTVDLRARFLGSSRFHPVTTGRIRVSTYKGIPAEGSEYWNPRDGCGYVVEHRVWVGKICSRQLVDSSGRRIEDLFDLYEYNPSSSTHAGNFVVEQNTEEPGWFEFRVPGNSLFEVVLWAAIKESEPSAPPAFEVDLGGKDVWISEAELKRDLEAQRAAAAGQQAAPPATQTVTIGGVPPSAEQALDNMLNGFDALGGSEELAQSFSAVYSLNLMDPVNTYVCGSSGFLCE
jgi:hypothetical protein